MSSLGTLLAARNLSNVALEPMENFPPLCLASNANVWPNDSSRYVQVCAGLVLDLASSKSKCPLGFTRNKRSSPKKLYSKKCQSCLLETSSPEECHSLPRMAVSFCCTSPPTKEAFLPWRFRGERLRDLASLYLILNSSILGFDCSDCGPTFKLRVSDHSLSQPAKKI